MKYQFKSKIPFLFAFTTILGIYASPGVSAPLSFSNVPLFLTNSGKPNVLMMFGNSNSMDSDATGAAVGSAAATSKSEIARNAMENVIADNVNNINMGLLAYQQNAMSSFYLHDSQYDASYNPLNYNSSYNGVRSGTTKRFRVPNPTSAGNYIHYNVDLPFYAGSNLGNGFCYSSTACTDPTHDFKGTSGSGCATAENPTTGPWDTYSCSTTKTGISDAAPGALGAGYGATSSSSFSPTDSDLGQGITDFGKRLAYQYVSRAWYVNSSPGKGYLHTPIALLDSTQANKLNTKLGTSQFTNNQPTNASFPLQNAGLSPLEGTVLTANNYFNGVAIPASQGGAAPAIPNSCGKNFLVLLTDGLPSVDQNGNASANVTANLTGATTQVGALKSSAANVETYMIGFALPFGVNPNQLDTIAAAGGTGSSYYADDAASLKAAFKSIFGNIAAKVGSASSVAVNGGSITSTSRFYQAKFSSLDWSGQLLSVALNTNGSLGSTIWDAGQKINTQSDTSRVILTYKPSTQVGIPFRWPLVPLTPSATEMDTSQSAALSKTPGGITDINGIARLSYIRGNALNEGSSGLQFRARNTSKLGDIVNSAPTYVGAPVANYNMPGYANYRLANKNRTPVVYVGANDGMLHGFDANTGLEVMAYVPSTLYPNLTLLTANPYSHRFFVDGSPSTSDVYYGGSWYTTLISGMGAGGKGIFGLDITNPANFTESNAANLVNFEFPNATTATADANDVGYISGQIPIVKLNNGVWAAIFGNGYNSTGTGYASLFIVNVQTGALIKKITTSVGSTSTPNALSNPIAIDTDGNQTADVVYAGDLQGNMWKFDISGSSVSSWNLAYKLYSANQPITTTPDVARNPNGGFMIYFGTGKYIESSDISNTAANTFYGIWDNFNGTVSSSSLVQQSVTGTVTATGGTYRTVTQNAVNYTASVPAKGWYMILPTSGERSVSDPTVRGGRVIFTTIIPASGVCANGGTSWFMELDYLSGGRLTSPPFDTNGDGLVSAASDLAVGGLGLSNLNSGGTPVSTGSTGEVRLVTSSDGSVNSILGAATGPASRRTSWRQLQLK